MSYLVILSSAPFPGHCLLTDSPSLWVVCFFFNLFFYWRIIALQNFVVFCQTSTWMSHRYTYIPSLLNLLPSPSPSHPSRLIHSPYLSFLARQQIWVVFSCLFVCLVIFDWMPDTVIFLSYICLLVHGVLFSSCYSQALCWAGLSYLGTVWSFQVLLLALVGETRMAFYLFLLFPFLAAWLGLQDLRSPTRYWTWAMAVWTWDPHYWAPRERPSFTSLLSWNPPECPSQRAESCGIPLLPGEARSWLTVSPTDCFC